MRRELEIVCLGHRGDGIAETADGPVYVPCTLPGEVVSAEVGEGDRARDVKILKPSPARRSPPCRHFGQCGGCALQHMIPSAYRDCKRDLVAAALAGQGLPADVAPLLTLPAATRRRATLAARRIKSGVLLGYRAARGHDIVALAECPVLAPGLAARLEAFKPVLAPLLSRKSEARVQITQADNGIDLVLEGAKAGLAPEAVAEAARASRDAGIIRMSIDGEAAVQRATPVVRFGAVPVDLPQGAFLQASGEAEQALLAAILDGVGDSQRVADLFSGLGTFTFPLAQRAIVLAVESDGAALGALAAAARRTPGFDARITTEQRNLAREPLSARELSGYDAVIFDPPRAGARAQAAEIAASAVPRVIAVSCNPATLARDLRLLIDGGYRLERIQPVDQFVYSAHVEVVAVLER